MGDVNEITKTTRAATTYSNTDFDVSPGFSFETGIGYRFNPNLRLEATYGQNQIEIEDSVLFDSVTTRNFFITRVLKELIKY